MRRDWNELMNVVDELINIIGAEQLLDELTRGLDCDELNNAINYIIRQYDLNEYFNNDDESEDID